MHFLLYLRIAPLKDELQHSTSHFLLSIAVEERLYFLEILNRAHLSFSLRDSQKIHNEGKLLHGGLLWFCNWFLLLDDLLGLLVVLLHGHNNTNL